MTNLKGDDSLPIFERVMLTMMASTDPIVLSSQKYAELLSDGRTHRLLNPSVRIGEIEVLGTTIRRDCAY